MRIKFISMLFEERSVCECGIGMLSAAQLWERGDAKVGCFIEIGVFTSGTSTSVSISASQIKTQPWTLLV